MAKDDKNFNLEKTEEEITKEIEEVITATKDTEAAEEATAPTEDAESIKKPDVTTEKAKTSDEAVDKFINDIIEEDLSVELESEKPEYNTTSKTTNEDSVTIENEQMVAIDDTEGSDNNSVNSKETDSSPTEKIVEVDNLVEEHTEPNKASLNINEPVTTELSNAIQEETTNKSIIVPKKKSKAPIIIFLCLLLCVIGGVIAWLILRSTPEAQVTDAISGLLTAKQVSTTGSLNVKFDKSTNPDIRSVKLDIGATSAPIPATTSATLSVTTQSNSTFKIDLGEAISRDGTIYIKISGLQKAIDSAKVPDEAQSYLDYFADVIEEADDQWWEISIPDLLDQVSDTIDQDVDTNDYIDAYQCIINQIVNNNGSELANLYKQYPFVDVSSYTGSQIQPTANGTVFNASINRSKLSDFENNLNNTEYQKALKRCTDKVTSSSSSDISTQINNTFDAIAEFPPVYIEVAGFEHRLARVYYEYETEDASSITIDFSFSFPDNVSINIPTNTRSITELIDYIVDDLEYMLYDIYYSSRSVEDCTSDDRSAKCCTSDDRSAKCVIHEYTE